MSSDTRNNLIDAAIWVGYIVAINLFSRWLPKALALGVSTSLFSFIRAIIGLDYKGFGVRVILPREEREGVARALIRSTVVGALAGAVGVLLARLGWL